VALSLQGEGSRDFHGFGIAQTMRDRQGSRALTSHGTLYKALGRLEELGLLTSSWEDAATVEGRPRRRLYRLTGEGAAVARRAAAEADDLAPGRALGVAPTPA